MFEKLKFWNKEKETEEEFDMEKEVEKNFHILSEMAAELDPEDPRYDAIQAKMAEYVGMKNDLHTDEVEPEKGAKAVLKRIFDTITDPKVIATGIASAVYIWWGERCMYYDENGHVPPNRMLGNGPMPPKV